VSVIIHITSILLHSALHYRRQACRLLLYNYSKAILQITLYTYTSNHCPYWNGQYILFCSNYLHLP